MAPMATRLFYQLPSWLWTPDRLSSIEAAACWMQYCTAYMLIEFGGMKRGSTVLITAAASSVGTGGGNPAGERGWRKTADRHNHQKRRQWSRRLLDAGAKAVINTKEANLVEEVRRLTNGKGANIIFDPVVGPQLEALCVKPRRLPPQIFLYGLLDPRPVPFPLLAALSKDLSIYTYNLTLITGNPERLERVKTWISKRLESGELKPTIARTFPFNQMGVEAHRYMESSEQDRQDL